VRWSKYEIRQSGLGLAGGVEPSTCMASAPVEGASASGGGSSDGPSTPPSVLMLTDG
jgi:hypothetical protein